MSVSTKLWRILSKRMAIHALSASAAIVAALETAMAVANVSLDDLLDGVEIITSWQVRAALCFTLFAILFVLTYFALFFKSRNGVSVEIAGTAVSVKIDDLFSHDEKCLKVIPFNERFDTEVNDVIISRSSLNGIFIDHHVGNLAKLRGVTDRQTPSALGEPRKVNEELVYELGTVKVYEDYALLAFTRFNEHNEAHLCRGDYEYCLANMWRELSRVYAGRKVCLPLLGSGITRFDDPTEEEPDRLLRCMLCTLKASGLSFKSGVEIALTKKTARRMLLFDVEDYAKTWL